MISSQTVNNMRVNRELDTCSSNVHLWNLCVCVCVCTLMCKPEDHACLPQSSSTLCFETGSLSELGSHQFSHVDRLETLQPPNLLSSTHSVPGLQAISLWDFFSMCLELTLLSWLSDRVISPAPVLIYKFLCTNDILNSNNCHREGNEVEDSRINFCDK